MKVLLTGVSSFTGCHIGRALVENGFDVCGTLTRLSPDYSGNALIQTRLEYSKLKNFVYEAPFGSKAFVRGIKEFSPEILISHGAPIHGYRSPDFDQESAYQRAVFNLDETVACFKNSGGRKMIYSGTVFEPIDGADALSPYGQMKKRVSDALEQTCETYGIVFSKVYIPNPVGPFENEDRLIPIFVKKWKNKEKPLLSAPRLVWDNLPANWLAEVYADESLSPSARERRPSGYKISLEQFMQLFKEKLSLFAPSFFCEFDVEDRVEPGALRLNTEDLLIQKSPSEQHEFWEQWFQSLGLVDEK